MISAKKFIKFIKNRIILDSNEIKFINHNIKLWSKNKDIKSNKVILVDLFNWNPFICFWSYLVNFLSSKFKAEIKFFYFNLYQTKGSEFSIYINKLKKIYNSFNVKEGISEYNFKYTNSENKIYLKKYNQFKKIDQIINFKRNNILLGDLIWDTYLRINHKPTVTRKDDSLKKIFFRANKIYDEVNKYFNLNKVMCVIPSHTYYISYGIICRIAAKRKVPIIKLFAKNFGNNQFHLIKLKKSRKSQNITEEYPFFEFRKTFKKLSNKKKIIGLKKGKEILKQRTSGEFDKTVPYMKLSSFNNLRSNNKILKSKKPKIFLFPHCYIDAPHRYRSILFNDFYNQMKFFLDISKKLKKFQWYYKPHPNELKWGRNIHSSILKDYPNVTRLNKDFSHRSVISSKPELIITNHGTIAHEYAAFKVPVLCTGDNPHINYSFCIHGKSLKNLKDILFNLKREKSKINFDKKGIYEYLFMRYEYFINLYEKDKFINDKYFALKNIKKNETSDVFLNFIKYSKLKENSINSYLNNFYKENF